MALLPGIELRRVPLDWEHPLDEQGEYIPLLPRDELNYVYSPEDLAFLREHGQGPISSEKCMPDFSDVPPERMGWRAYHVVNEGEPATPAFPDTPEGREALIAYAADNVKMIGRPIGRTVAAELFDVVDVANEIAQQPEADQSYTLGSDC